MSTSAQFHEKHSCSGQLHGYFTNPYDMIHFITKHAYSYYHIIIIIIIVYFTLGNHKD